MQEKNQLLYCGDFNGRIINILPRFGQVTLWDGAQQFTDYNIVLIDYDRYPNLAKGRIGTIDIEASIFSDLNNLEDITLSKHFNNLAGITQQELEMNFTEELNFLPRVLDTEKDPLLENIKSWYNGYSWDGKG